MANNLTILKKKLKSLLLQKLKKPLIDLLGKRQNLSLKTIQTKTIEKVEQMLLDLQKIKN